MASPVPPHPRCGRARNVLQGDGGRHIIHDRRHVRADSTRVRPRAQLAEIDEPRSSRLVLI
ncbi:MAG TPA: hypothetical protein VFM91_03640, partial [Propionibacteriaceae bacterium]|nr:hypothetical protein [Propionibacteriaceae bacterium]